MDATLLSPNLLWWVLGLVIGLAVLVGVLGEWSERLERDRNPMAQTLRRLRHLIVPLLAVLYILHWVMEVTDFPTWLRVVQTCVWLGALLTGLNLFANLARLQTARPTSWVAKLPALMFALGRALVIVVIVYYVAAHVWSINVTRLTTALGVGSLIIALALQSTLSNLVSGFLLLADRPFTTGHYVSVGDDRVPMRVEQVSWRAARFRTLRDFSLVIIPNGVLGNEIIRNYGERGTPYRWVFYFSFSHEHHPNEVIRVLTNAVRDIGGVLDNPAPVVRAWNLRHQEFAMEYRMDIYCGFLDHFNIRNDVYRNVYYAAKRHNLTLPRPARDVEIHTRQVESPEKLTTSFRQRLLEVLRSTLIFRSLPAEKLQDLADHATVQVYGAGEQIIKQGQADEGLYVIQSGAVTLTASAPEGQRYEIVRLAEGDIFGEMALLQGEFSPVSVIVTTDVHVLIINQARMSQLMGTHPQFTRDMNIFIEERQRLLEATLGVDVFAEREEHREMFQLIAGMTLPGDVARCDDGGAEQVR